MQNILSYKIKKKIEYQNILSSNLKENSSWLQEKSSMLWRCEAITKSQVSISFCGSLTLAVLETVTPLWRIRQIVRPGMKPLCSSQLLAFFPLIIGWVFPQTGKNSWYIVRVGCCQLGCGPRCTFTDCNNAYFPTTRNQNK